MTLVFFAQDNEFGSATGGNVNVTSNTSEFDDPPSDSTDLQITANEGDGDPRLFELGDWYDVSWNTPDGPLRMEDAVVVRSDAAPGDGGIIVLEGTDQFGNPAQVIWTPDFNLQGWYSSNGGGDPDTPQPQFYVEDTNPSYSHTFVCFVAGTLIDTPAGPRPVEALRAGDDVLTLDAGAQSLVWTGRRRCSAWGKQAPICFDVGVLDNTAPLLLSPQHRVLIRSPRAEMTSGNSEVFAPAKSFVATPGVHVQLRQTVEYVHIMLGAHHAVWANGALCETLLPGPEAQAVFHDDPGFRAVSARIGAVPPARPILRSGEVRALLLAGFDHVKHTPLRMCSQPRSTPVPACALQF